MSTTSSPPPLPVFTRGTGPRENIDPSSNSALYDAVDASDDNPK